MHFSFNASSFQVGPTYSGAVLSCDAAKMLHIRWAAGTIELREGSRTLLTYTDHDPIPVSHLGLATPDGVKAEVRLTHVPPGSFYLKPSSFQGGITMSTHKSVFAFDARSCYGVALYLSNGTHDTHFVSIGYEDLIEINALFGGGYVSVLSIHVAKSLRQQMYYCYIPKYIISTGQADALCSRLRQFCVSAGLLRQVLHHQLKVLSAIFSPFWVTWNATRVAVGWHATFTDELLALDDLVDVDVKLVNLVSLDSTGDTEFILAQETGM